jgi:hypothetical protein
LLNVAVSASHVIYHVTVGTFSVVYSSIDPINTLQLSSPILSCNNTGNGGGDEVMGIKVWRGGGTGTGWTADSWCLPQPTTQYHED